MGLFVRLRHLNVKSLWMSKKNWIESIRKSVRNPIGIFRFFDVTAYSRVFTQHISSQLMHNLQWNSFCAHTTLMFYVLLCAWNSSPQNQLFKTGFMNRIKSAIKKLIMALYTRGIECLRRWLALAWKNYYEDCDIKNRFLFCT